MNFINQNNDMIQNMIQNMFMNNNNIDYIFPNDNVIKEINKYLDNSEIFKNFGKNFFNILFLLIQKMSIKSFSSY